MKKTMLKNVAKNEYFTLSPIEYPTDKQVYIKQEYDRQVKKYLVNRYDDMLSGGKYLKSDTIVYIDFIF